MNKKLSLSSLKIGGYYHLRLGSRSGQRLFGDAQDAQVFTDSLTRKLTVELAEDVSLLGIALAPDHCHLLVYLHWMTGVDDLIRSLKDTYVSYFYDRYGYDQAVWRVQPEIVELSSAREAGVVLQYLREHQSLPGDFGVDYSSVPCRPLAAKVAVRDEDRQAYYGWSGSREAESLAKRLHIFLDEVEWPMLSDILARVVV